MVRLRAVLLLIVLLVLAACSALPTGLPPRAPSTATAPVSTIAPDTSAPLPTSEADDVTPNALARAPGLAVTACRTGWGSLPRTDPAMGTAAITGLRVGRHACFDRIVVDIGGTATGYTASYVDTVTADGSGAPVTVPGGARIQLVIRHPAATSAAVGADVANVAGFTTLRSVRAAGSFEGITTFGVGTRGRLPFRIFVLQNPGRIILDVSHRW